MFDFQNLDAYNKIRKLNSQLYPILKRIEDIDFKRQLSRATFSIQLNLAEGSGRFGDKDRRRFYIIGRASLYECVAILDILSDMHIINEVEYRQLHNEYQELSKMMFAMIRRLE